MPFQSLADDVLALHAAVAAFVVGGLGLILVGKLRHWDWVNAPGFRIAHAGAIAVVIAETWVGLTCPLTHLEMWLREQAGNTTYSGSFVACWLQRLLFYEAPPWVFALNYTLFGVLAAATWLRFPPKSKRRHSPSAAD